MLVDPKDQKDFSRYLGMSQAGLEMVVPIGIGVAVDYYANTGPWGAVVGAILGLVGGLSHLVYMTRKNDDSDKKPPKPTSGTP